MVTAPMPGLLGRCKQDGVPSANGSWPKLLVVAVVGKQLRDWMGFDPADDVPVAALAEPDGSRVQRPLHIVGTAVNLNRGRQLAWQSRRAASFTFTPLHAGYEPTSAQVRGGYRPVSQ